MKLIRKLLFPFSILYGGITAFRNFLFDKGILKSESYGIPVVCVGNLSTGGTGKSPMIEFLIELLSEDYKVAVLSRGYKRKTKGYIEVNPEATAQQVGDEPLQFKKKFPNCTVAVCADRREGISNLQEKAEIVLLDDAFQHRKVTPSTSILLTPFNDLYVDDFMLPTGNLREWRIGAKRADFIVVTKCPDSVPYAKFQEIQFRLGLEPHQKVYFSKIGYDHRIYSASEILPLKDLQGKNFTLVTGIANPTPLVDFLNLQQFKFNHKKFSDHHHFTASEIETLQKHEIILTTEKDYMRLQSRLDKYALYYLPIKTKILKGQEDFFKEEVMEAILQSRFN